MTDTSPERVEELAAASEEIGPIIVATADELARLGTPEQAHTIGRTRSTMLAYFADTAATLRALSERVTMLEGGWRPIDDGAKTGDLVLLYWQPKQMALARWYSPWGCWISDSDPIPRDPGEGELYGIGALVPTLYCIPAPPEDKG